MGPQVGEAVAGDVVNTTSRMQSLAPLDSVVIGEATLRAVRDRFEVEALPSATVKGKSEPLRVWRVVAERAEVETDRTPFVGRRSELAALAERFDDVVRSRSSHVVTVVAEAGVGKSRLVAELARSLGDRARRLTGTCLPYGEGVTFAPVEQTVRELIGIEPSADMATSAALLEAHAGAHRARPAGPPLAASGRSSAVLGLEATLEGPSLGADEIAQAWARVLAAAADERPVLLVIEDLHDAMTAFVDVLAATVELLRTRPVLIVATTRPMVGAPAGRARALLDARRRRPGRGRGPRARRLGAARGRGVRGERARRCSSGRPATRCTRSSSRGCSRRAEPPPTPRRRRPCRR